MQSLEQRIRKLEKGRILLNHGMDPQQEIEKITGQIALLKGENSLSKIQLSVSELFPKSPTTNPFIGFAPYIPLYSTQHLVFPSTVLNPKQISEPFTQGV